MSAVCRIIIVCLALTYVAGAQPVQGGFSYGERPANSIFDPSGILDTEEAEAISSPLLTILENEKIDVMVVILPELGAAPALHLARGIAEKWSEKRINAVVLHVPGEEDSPWIFPGKIMSSTLKPEVMKQSIDEAQSRARAEPSDFGKVRAASIEATDVMRFWMGNTIMRSEEAINRQLQARLAFEKRQRLIKLSLALGAAALIPLVIGVVFFLLRIRNSGSRTFPPMRVIRRFGAPYSGGNNATSK